VKTIDVVDVISTGAASAGESEIELDTALTPELKEEGNVRELIRAIQDLRKKENLIISDSADLKIMTDDQGKAFIERNTPELMKTTGLSAINCVVEFYGGEETAIDGYRFGLSLLKK